MNPENAIGVLPWPRWDDLYQRGLVKLDVRPDEEQFDDSWCEDPKENADLWRQIEREGVWDLFYCYRTHPSHRWTEQHFCGAFVGDQWKYAVNDARTECIDALDKLFEEQAQELAGRATFAAGGPT